MGRFFRAEGYFEWFVGVPIDEFGEGSSAREGFTLCKEQGADFLEAGDIVQAAEVLLDCFDAPGELFTFLLEDSGEFFAKQVEPEGIAGGEEFGA